MSKSELIDAISHEGGVKLAVLTKEELLRLGRPLIPMSIYQ
jgi:hypothetical protein